MITFCETHDALDEIPPPSAARQLIGHRDAVDYLLRATSSGHHAVIMEGEAGIGKATTAFLAAKTLCGAGGNIVEGIDTESAAHRQIAQGSNPNVMHLTRPWSHQTKKWKTVITVDEVRRLQPFFGMTANQSDPRIVIVDTVQDMNRNAANALLKMLEEPPSNALFLLISQGLGSVLPTIRSRAQVVRFGRLSEVEVGEALRVVAKDVISDDKARQLAELSGGSVRHALLMGLYGGAELLEAVSQLLSADAFDTSRAHKLADLAADRKQQTQGALLFDMLVEALHSHALHCARSGDLRRADTLAHRAQTLREERRTSEAFNLDARQDFLVAAHKAHGAIHGMA